MIAPLSRWADDHRGAALDVVRVYLGVGLLVRGVIFLAEPTVYLDLLPNDGDGAFGSFAVLHYVGLAHVGGGLLLTLGLLTRLAALVQIPVLAGAALLVHLPAGLTDQSFAFAALVLALLVVFAVWGGGPWSLDRAIAAWTDRDEREEDERAAATVAQLRARERSRGPAPPRPAEAGGAALPACTCGHDRQHDHVEVERSYGSISALRFATGTHPRPSQVVYRCHDCGGAVAIVDDPEELEAFRYERPRRGAGSVDT